MKLKSNGPFTWLIAHVNRSAASDDLTPTCDHPDKLMLSIRIIPFDADMLNEGDSGRCKGRARRRLKKRLHNLIEIQRNPRVTLP